MPAATMADVREKKRKRNEDGSSLARKKATAQAAPQPRVITISSIKSAGSCPPVIATSPGLSLPKSVDFRTYTKPAPSSTKKSKKAAPRPETLLLHAAGQRKLDYTAKEDGPDGRESHLKHYIGVFDPETGKLSIIEAKKMAVRGKVRAQEPEDDTSDQRRGKTNLELRNDLGEAFGTKKARKAIASISENAISSSKPTKPDGSPKKLDASSQALMASMREVTKGMATTEELQAAVDEAKPVPPGDFEAELIQDVYKPERMIGAEIMNAIPIKDWQDAVKKKENLQMEFRFVSSRLNQTGEGPEPSRRLRILRYLDFLVKVLKYAKPGKDRGTLRLPQREKLTEILKPAPQPVIDSIRRKFSEAGNMAKYHVQLLRTYCCALAAILANFEFETSFLRQDLSLDEKQFAQYFKEIGGKINYPTGADKGTRIQVAKLALPLEFPKVRFQRRR